MDVHREFNTLSSARAANSIPRAKSLRAFPRSLARLFIRLSPFSFARATRFARARSSAWKMSGAEARAADKQFSLPRYFSPVQKEKKRGGEKIKTLHTRVSESGNPLSAKFAILITSAKLFVRSREKFARAEKQRKKFPYQSDRAFNPSARSSNKRVSRGNLSWLPRTDRRTKEEKDPSDSAKGLSSYVKKWRKIGAAVNRRRRRAKEKGLGACRD